MVDLAPVTPSADSGPRLEFHPTLVEEAVLISIEGQPADIQQRFRTARNPVYELDDPEERQSRFEELHSLWFVELGLAEPLHRALAEQPAITHGVSFVLVVPVTTRKEEFADLARPPGSHDRPRLLLRLRVTTLVTPERLSSWLRRELLYVVDLLDPGFAYDESLAGGGQNRALEKLFQQRYRVLWRTSIEGRMVARGWLPPDAEQRARDRFVRTFSSLGGSSSREFDRFFRGPRATHPELVAFATDPPMEKGRRAPSDGCAICRMPAGYLYPKPESLPAGVVQAIRHDFPTWQPQDGLCIQCSDLYAATSNATTAP